MVMFYLINHVTLAMLSKVDEALDLLECAISQGIQFKVKAQKSKSFEKLSDDSKSVSIYDYNQCGISKYPSILSFRKILRRAFA